MDYLDPAAGSLEQAVPSHDSSTRPLPFARARSVHADGVALIGLSYLAIRPTFEAGDHTVTAALDEAEECQIQFGEGDKPAYAAAFYDRVADAIDDALDLLPHYPHLALWYDGHELLTRFVDWRSLAVDLSEGDEAWEIVEDVATGRLNPADTKVHQAIADNELIGVALERARP